MGTSASFNNSSGYNNFPAASSSGISGPLPEIPPPQQIAPHVMAPPTASTQMPTSTPAQQAAALAWENTLDTRDPVYGTPDDIAYQVRVAGQPELYVPYAQCREVKRSCWSCGRWVEDFDGVLDSG